MNASQTKTIYLDGRLDFDRVPDIWREVEAQIRPACRLVLDFAAVKAVNSAGLALLLEARSHASQCGCGLEANHLPPALVDLAELCGVEELIEQPIGVRV